MVEFLNSKYGIYFITALIFVMMGALLRFLFGPKGIFKQKDLTYGSDNKKNNEIEE